MRLMTSVSFRSVPAIALALTFTACGDDSSGTGTATEDGTAGTATTSTTAGPTTNDPTTNSTSTTDQTTTGPTTGVDTTDDTTTTGELPCPYTPIEDAMPTVELELVAEGFTEPVLAVGHPTEQDRLFVVEKTGTIKILEAGDNMAPADNFLQVGAAGGSEQGLLGFAFHPDYPDDPRVYIAYNPPEGGSPATTVSEFMVGMDGTADANTERVVIAADQPQVNHNGGMIAFGPDGYLYFATGDGGGGGDTYDTGRNTSYILAKMLRIDVEPDGNDDSPVACGMSCNQLGPFDYTIPADNPFVNDPSFAPEIYAWGFRNPWRFAFDQETGDLYVADVGQGGNAGGGYEEVSIVQAGSDHGWPDVEGLQCYQDGACDIAGPNEVNADGITMPLTDYDSGTTSRCTIIGLGVYRSCEVPAFDGVYFYADLCTDEVFAVAWDGQEVTEFDVVANVPGIEETWGGGYNAYGDVFVTTDSPGGGRVYRVTAAQ